MTPTFQSADLSSNQYSGLPSNTLQLVLFYDGNNTCSFAFEYRDTNGTIGSVGIKEIKPFGTEIRTAQYAMNGATLTGNFSVRGVQANGVVDGLAFGIFWRDATGNYHILRSNSAAPAPQACFVSAWPLGVAINLPQVTNPIARGTAQAVISGAKLLPDGTYTLPVL